MSIAGTTLKEVKQNSEHFHDMQAIHKTGRVSSSNIVSYL